MKTTTDNKEVPSRCWYYLLDFNDRNRKELICSMFLTDKLHCLTFKEFWELFKAATEQEIKRSLKIE